jgi:hypothetical protein
MGQGKVYEWVERFKNGRWSVISEEQSGHLITSNTVTSVDRVYTLIQKTDGLLFLLWLMS